MESLGKELWHWKWTIGPYFSYFSLPLFLGCPSTFLVKHHELPRINMHRRNHLAFCLLFCVSVHGCHTVGDASHTEQLPGQQQTGSHWCSPDGKFTVWRSGWQGSRPLVRSLLTRSVLLLSVGLGRLNSNTWGYAQKCFVLRNQGGYVLHTSASVYWMCGVCTAGCIFFSQIFLFEEVFIVRTPAVKSPSLPSFRLFVSLSFARNLKTYQMKSSVLIIQRFELN